MANGIPNIQTARLRALRGEEDPSLSVRTEQQAAPIPRTLPRPVQPPPLRSARPSVAPTIPVQPTPTTQPLPIPQETIRPQSGFLALALNQGALPATRQAAQTLARLRAQRDFEQTQL